MAKLSITGVLSTLSILVQTWFQGKKAGTDGDGNVYYHAPAKPGYQRERRWVVYKDKVEASLVPPEYHGWLHHQTDVFPEPDNDNRQTWQQEHQPNMTGTANAYVPPGHMAKGGIRDKATGDYEAWNPDR